MITKTMNNTKKIMNRGTGRLLDIVFIFCIIVAAVVVLGAW